MNYLLSVRFRSIGPQTPFLKVQPADVWARMASLSG
jgi:hypothetical protein